MLIAVDVEMVTLDIIHYYLLRLQQLPSNSQSPLPSRHHLEININVVRNNPVCPSLKFLYLVTVLPNDKSRICIRIPPMVRCVFVTVYVGM